MICLLRVLRGVVAAHKGFHVALDAAVDGSVYHALEEHCEGLCVVLKEGQMGNFFISLPSNERKEGLEKGVKDGEKGKRKVFHNLQEHGEGLGVVLGKGR